MNGYNLSKNWFDFCSNNPEKIKPIHSAIYFFAVEHCNNLGWKEKFGFPTTMTMNVIGVKKYQTYGKALKDLEDWGFITFIERSKNQYSANIITLNAMPKKGRARGKARSEHGAKHGRSTGQSTGQSTGHSKDSITKPLNYETIKPLNKETARAKPKVFGVLFENAFNEFLDYLEEEHKKNLGASSQEILCQKFSRLCTEEQACRVLETVVSNGWQTINDGMILKYKENGEFTSKNEERINRSKQASADYIRETFEP